MHSHHAHTTISSLASPLVCTVRYRRPCCVRPQQQAAVLSTLTSPCRQSSSSNHVAAANIAYASYGSVARLPISSCSSSGSGFGEAGDHASQHSSGLGPSDMDAITNSRTINTTSSRGRVGGRSTHSTPTPAAAASRSRPLHPYPTHNDKVKPHRVQELMFRILGSRSASQLSQRLQGPRAAQLNAKHVAAACQRLKMGYQQQQQQTKQGQGQTQEQQQGSQQQQEEEQQQQQQDQQDKVWAEQGWSRQECCQLLHHLLQEYVLPPDSSNLSSSSSSSSSSAHGKARLRFTARELACVLHAAAVVELQLEEGVLRRLSQQAAHAAQGAAAAAAAAVKVGPRQAAAAAIAAAANANALLLWALQRVWQQQTHQQQQQQQPAGQEGWHHPYGPWVGQYLGATWHTWRTYPCRSLAVYILALARLKPALSRQQAQALVAAVQQQLPSASSRDLAVFLWGLSVLQLQLPQALLVDWCRVSAARLAFFSKRDLSAACVALARLRYQPSPRFLYHLFEQLYWTVDQFELAQVACLLWALGRLQVRVPQELSQRLGVFAGLQLTAASYPGTSWQQQAGSPAMAGASGAISSSGFSGMSSGGSSSSSGGGGGYTVDMAALQQSPAWAAALAAMEPEQQVEQGPQQQQQQQHDQQQQGPPSGLTPGQQLQQQRHQHQPPPMSQTPRQQEQQEEDQAGRSFVPHPQELSMALSGVAAGSWQPPTDWLVTMTELVLDTLPWGTPQALNMWCRALAKLKASLTEQQQARILQEAIRRLGGLPVTPLVGGTHGSPPQVEGGASDSCTGAQQLQLVAFTLAPLLQLGMRPPGELADAWLRPLAACFAAASVGQVYVLLACCGQLGWVPSAPWWASLEEWTTAAAGALTGGELLAILGTFMAWREAPALAPGAVAALQSRVRQLQAAKEVSEEEWEVLQSRLRVLVAQAAVDAVVEAAQASMVQ